MPDFSVTSTLPAQPAEPAGREEDPDTLKAWGAVLSFPGVAFSVSLGSGRPPAVPGAAATFTVARARPFSGSGSRMLDVVTSESTT